MIDRRGRFVAVGPAFASLVGGTVCGMVGLRAARFVHRDDRRRAARALRAASEGREAPAIAARIGQPGAWRIVEWRVAEAGPGGWLRCVGRHVTDQSAAERRLGAIERLAPVGAWSLDAGAGRVLLTAGARRLLGLDPDLETVATAAFVGAFSPSASFALRAAIDRLTREGAAFDLIAPSVSGERPIRVTGAATLGAGGALQAEGLLLGAQEVHTPGAPVAAARTSRADAPTAGDTVLRTAVEALPDAFAYYDRDDRLRAFNQRYVEYYPRSADAIVEGARFVDILRHGLANGEYRSAVGREEDWLAERMARHAAPENTLEQELADGRWLRVIERATPDGGRVGMRIDITALKEAERRLADVLRGAEVGVWEWDLRAGRVEVNERWAQIVGHDHAALASMTADRWSAFTHPEDAGASAAAFEACFTGRSDFWRTETRLRRSDGRWVWALERGQVSRRDAKGRPLRISGILLDITERKTAELALKASEERLRGLFEAMPDGILLIDAETRTPFDCNETATRMLGYDRAALCSLPVERMDGLDGAAEAAAHIETILREGAANFETNLIRSDGKMLPAAVSVVALRESERPALLSVFRDISEFRAQNAALEAAREEAEAASRAKSMFLATMSHEIRTPMNGVIGMADALSRRLTDPDHKRMADTILDSGEGLLTILNDILDFSKIEAGRMELEQTPFHPSELAARVVSLHALRAESKAIGFRVRVEPEGACRRIGDVTRLLQVLHNLVGNAVKFTLEGEVEVILSAPRGAPLTATVRDTGIGMNTEQLERLFTPFSQADSSTTRRFGGTGLGMSIVARLVALMGGSLGVQSLPGEGTCVRIELPLAEVQDDADDAETGAVEQPAALAGLRILAADDNIINRMVLEEMLEALGVEAVIVEGGEEAVAAAEGGRFDMILLDISMPEVCGDVAVARIREDERRTGRPRTPAIAVSANAFPEQIAAYMAAGFDAHLAKPINLEALRASMARTLRRSAPA
jgi:PAS domain S-box-containing protein